jgi:hypothetical protein
MGLKVVEIHGTGNGFDLELCNMDGLAMDPLCAILSQIENLKLHGSF